MVKPRQEFLGPITKLAATNIGGSWFSDGYVVDGYGAEIHNATMVLNARLTSPITGAHRGSFWVNDTANPTLPMFTDSNGNIIGLGTPFPVSSQIIFISSIFGSDLTGNGTMSNPYATIAKAYSVITTASASQIWEVMLLPGTYTENVTILPFINLIGWESSAIEDRFYPAHIIGTFTLDSTFSTTRSVAAITNIDLDGSITLNFVATSSADGMVSFTNCQIENTSTMRMNIGNSVEFHNCTILDDLTQIGGNVNLWNTNGIASTLTVQGPLGSSTSFQAWNGAWSGTFTADASANTLTDTLAVALFNFSVDGAFNIISSDTVNPTVESDYGLLKENPSLVGAAAGLSLEMRVVHQFSIGSGVSITGSATTAIPLTVPSTLLGTTSIELLLNTANCIGSGWGNIFNVKGCSVSFQFLNTGGNNKVVVQIYNPGSTFTTSDTLDINWGGYLAFTPSS